MCIKFESVGKKMGCTDPQLPLIWQPVEYQFMQYWDFHIVCAVDGLAPLFIPPTALETCWCRWWLGTQMTDHQQLQHVKCLRLRTTRGYDAFDRWCSVEIHLVRAVDGLAPFSWATASSLDLSMLVLGMYCFHNNDPIHFNPLAFQAEGVLSLPASVRLSVRPSVNFFLSAR